MPLETPVEIADRYSRKRAVIVAVAALAFLSIHVALGPFFADGLGTARYATVGTMWAINAFVLLVVLATGGGLLNSTQIRSLVNDEVSQGNCKTSVVAAYWVAMTAAMTLYTVPRFQTLTAREAVYVVVTSSIVVALLTFSYLEYRAHRDA
jgi:MFS family permease